MDWRLAIEEELAAFKRIVALFLALAILAERASSRSQVVRGFVLWLLRHAEAAARNFVTGEPASAPLCRRGHSPADAMRLARNFRDLAGELGKELDSWAALAFSVSDSGQGEPTRFAIRRALRGVLNFALAFPTSARAALCPEALPDTS